jgi:hypothetical protein
MSHKKNGKESSVRKSPLPRTYRGTPRRAPSAGKKRAVSVNLYDDDPEFDGDFPIPLDVPFVMRWR